MALFRQSTSEDTLPVRDARLVRLACSVWYELALRSQYSLGRSYNASARSQPRLALSTREFLPIRKPILWRSANCAAISRVPAQSIAPGIARPLERQHRTAYWD